MPYSDQELLAFSSVDKLDCCGSYRECSDAKRCVIADRPYSAFCTYRKNLEAGRIFYGKNANNFSLDEYNKILSSVDLLPLDAAKYLDSLLIILREYLRATDRYIVRSKYIDELSDLGIFSFSDAGYSILSRAGATKLKNIIRRDDALWASFRKAEKSAPKDKSSSFVFLWLRQNKNILQQISSPYRLLSVVYEKRIYVEELYRDRCLASYDQHIYTLSPLAEDGLLRDADIQAEQNRINSFNRRKQVAE